MMRAGFTYWWLFFQFAIVDGDIKRASKIISNASFNGFKILEGIICEISSFSVVECSSLCTDKSPCMSINYNSITRTCVLLEDDVTDTASAVITAETGWRYWHVVRENEQKPANCTAAPTTGICSLFCLHYRPDNGDVDQPRTMCDYLPGGHLVKVNRRLKQHCVERLMESVGAVEVLIQGIRDEGLKVWLYDDDTVMTYFNWNTGGNQPDGRSTENYVGMKKSSGYRWHDYFTGNKHDAVCEQIKV